MKKILISIFGIFLGFSAFSSADSFIFDNSNIDSSVVSSYVGDGLKSVTSFYLDKSVVINAFSIGSDGPNYSLYDSLGNLLFSFDFDWSNPHSSSASSFCSSSNYYPFYCNIFAGEYFLTGKNSYYIKTDSAWISLYHFSPDFITGDSIFTFFPSVFSDFNTFVPIGYVDYTPLLSDTFIVNYGSTIKEYTITEDIDIFINSPVVKNGNTFTFDGSTGVNLFYNNQYEWYSKNNLYLDGYFNYTKGVFNPVCL